MTPLKLKRILYTVYSSGKGSRLDFQAIKSKVLIRDERTDIFSSSVLFCVLSKSFFSVLILFCSAKFEILVFCSVFC